MCEKIREDLEAGIYLRMMTRQDTDKIVAWRNSEAVRSRFLYRKPFTPEGHENWIKTMIETGKAIQLIICNSEDDRALGSVYIRDIEMEHRKAEYGIFIGEADARGRGIGTAAAKMMLSYCFEELKLHKVSLRVIADNLRAIGSYEKAGFVKEAYLKDEMFIDGQYIDIILMAIFEKDSDFGGCK